VPTYEYACTACADRLEVVQKLSDPALTECPSCGGALRKVFSPVGVVFKGSGFYKTDSRSSSSAKPASPAADSSATTPADKPATAPAAPAADSSSTAPAAPAAPATKAAS
jgi:putative FmdB family regulatory protein